MSVDDEERVFSGFTGCRSTLPPFAKALSILRALI
jgi:hypothetical protein